MYLLLQLFVAFEYIEPTSAHAFLRLVGICFEDEHERGRVFELELIPAEFQHSIDAILEAVVPRPARRLIRKRADKAATLNHEGSGIPGEKGDNELGVEPLTISGKVFGLHDDVRRIVTFEETIADRGSGGRRV